MKKKAEGLAAMTSREEDIMNILWRSSKPLLAKEIAEQDATLTINTVQAVLRKMLKNNWIKVEDIVYSNTVLARTYVPVITAEEYSLAKLEYEYQRLGSFVKKASLVRQLLKKEDKKTQKEEIHELESMLDEYKKKINSSKDL